MPIQYFNTGTVYIPRKAIEFHIRIPADAPSFKTRESVVRYVSNIISFLDIGAMRKRLEVTLDSGDWDCYMRYFPGRKEEYENAKEKNNNT